VAAVADHLCDGQNESNEAGGKAAERKYKREPAGIGMGTLMAYASEDAHGEQGSENASKKDSEAGAEEDARV